jgi:hypothetical protein
MRQPSFTRSVLTSALRSAARFVVALFDPSSGTVKKYCPEDHYMRGPGPKWREKHLADRASAQTQRKLYLSHRAKACTQFQ